LPGLKFARILSLFFLALYPLGGGGICEFSATPHRPTDSFRAFPRYVRAEEDPSSGSMSRTPSDHLSADRRRTPNFFFSRRACQCHRPLSDPCPGRRMGLRLRQSPRVIKPYEPGAVPVAALPRSRIKSPPFPRNGEHHRLWTRSSPYSFFSHRPSEARPFPTNIPSPTSRPEVPAGPVKNCSAPNVLPPSYNFAKRFGGLPPSLSNAGLFVPLRFWHLVWQMELFYSSVVFLRVHRHKGIF